MSDSTGKSWRCKNCTISNIDKRGTCEACQFTRPLDASSLTPSKLLDKAQLFFAGIPDQVSSAVDTVQDIVKLQASSIYEAFSDQDVLQKTDLEDPTPARSTSEGTAQWSCIQCTLINFGEVTNCIACGTPHWPNEPTQEDETDVTLQRDPISGRPDLSELGGASEESIEKTCDSCGIVFDTNKTKHCPVCSFVDDDNYSLKIGDHNNIEEDRIAYDHERQLSLKQKRTLNKSLKSDDATGYLTNPTLLNSAMATSSKKGAWICKTCRFENVSESEICLVCRRQGTASKYGENCWSCPTCTLPNNAANVVCFACKTVKVKKGRFMTNKSKRKPMSV